MANIITEWLNPNNFTFLRDKFNAIYTVLSGGVVGQVLSKSGNGNGEFAFKNLMDLMPTGQPWETYETDLSVSPFNNNWITKDGSTLGNSASTAIHAGDAYKKLFLFVWNRFADDQCPVAGGRGADAESDYDANKKIAIPDDRGRFRVGYDARLADPSNGIWDAAYNAVGTTGGEKNHLLLSGESGQKAVTLTFDAGDPNIYGGVNAPFFINIKNRAASPPSGGLSIVLAPTDADNAHNTTPAFTVVNQIIKL